MNEHITEAVYRLLAPFTHEGFIQWNRLSPKKRRFWITEIETLVNKSKEQE